MVAKLGSVPTSQAWREHSRIVLSGIPGLMRFGADWLMRRVLEDAIDISSSERRQVSARI